MQDERADRVEDRDDGDGEQRRVRAVASGRLAVAADPEAGEGQEERGEAERAELGDVEHEAGPEARDRAEDRALRERDGDEHHEHEVGRAAEDPDRGDDRHLEDAATKKSAAAFAMCGHHGICGSRLVLTSTITPSSDLKSTDGMIWTFWNGSMSVWPTFVTSPIGIPRG